MLGSFRKNNWRNYLPAVHAWTETVEVANSKKLGQAQLTVVAAHPEGEFKMDWDGDLGSYSSGIESAVKSLGWKPASGAIQVGVEGRQFLIVPRSGLKVTAPQIARQFGIDLTTHLKGRTFDKLAVLSNCNPLDLFEGISTGLYDAGLFKGKKTDSPSDFPKAIDFVGADINAGELEQRRVLNQSTALTRMLQDAPANILDPMGFSEISRAIAEEAGLKIEVLGRDQMAEKGMGSFLSVAQGSPLEPQLITVEIPGRDSSKKVSLVGKGLTFDAGGISIKPSAGMDEMKYDMSGGAAVVGAMYYFSKVKPETNVVCHIGAVENMCSGTATRPGDIVTASNGKSIEILNTDAEGRLVLADVLTYTVKNQKPDLIVDAATLTGACLHALGHCGAAIMSNDDDTSDFLRKAAKDMGEPLWPLPLWAELPKEVKGQYSDLSNISKPNVKAGTIIGGIFLQEFVGDTKWAHLDIAGTAWSCQATGYNGGGGSGFGTRSMVAAVQRFGS